MTSPFGVGASSSARSADDVIWAVASPRGASVRGVIRISGEGAFGVASGALCAPDAIVAVRGVQRIRASVLGHAVGGLAMVMPGPRSFTGEDVVELHLPGSPLLLAQVGAALVAAGARHAAPGEFTRRAFEHGRLTLSEAEAVLDLIRAADVESARRAAAVLDGGIDRAVGGIRSAILDARAMLEAGLDFEEGETGDVEPEIWRAPLRRVAAQLDALAAEQPVGPGASDLVLLGPANAGKSSLCNALLGRDEFLVSDVPGTTRDVLEIELPGGGRLWDAPGDLGEGAAGTDAEALALRARLLGAAGGSLVVLDASRPGLPSPDLRGLPPICVVWTHIDVAAPDFVPHVPPGLGPGLPLFAIDAVRGAGLAELAAFLGRAAVRGREVAGARISGALERASAAVRAALTPQFPELCAADLDAAIACLDEVAGGSSPEDVLDRVFGRFCLGK